MSEFWYITICDGFDEVDDEGLEYECSACDIRFKISVKSTYKVVDIKSR